MLYQLKEKLASWGDKSNVGSTVFHTARKAVIMAMSMMPDEKYARWFYKTYTKKTLNLENPKTTCDKMWWLKLNNRDPLMTICSDKDLARNYVAECGYSDILIPQVGVYKNANEIDFEKFHKPVIAKCNNGSGGNCFYEPGCGKDIGAIRKKLNESLNANYYLISREWNYKNIPPRIVVEEVVRDKRGNVPSDYRFFCFDGVPKLLMMDIGVLNEAGRYMRGYPRNVYDMDFNLLPIRWGHHDIYDGHVDKPENFEYMKEIVTKLSEPFPMCRVDLYNLDGKIYFGEITFYHGGCSQNIEPKEWDERIASWIDLDSPRIVRKNSNDGM